jgi:hypothetical protein
MNPEAGATAAPAVPEAAESAPAAVPMSLRARLRLAVGLLMSAMVVVLSGLYMHGYLQAVFVRTDETATSLADQVQAGLRETLQRKAMEARPMPVTPGMARQFFQDTVAGDPAIQIYLLRWMEHWKLVEEIFITGESGRVLASTAPHLVTPGRPAHSLADWKGRSVIANMRQVYLRRQDTELRRPIAIVGESSPVLNIHVVISSVILWDDLRQGLWGVAEVCAACLVLSLILSLVLPNFVLSPLERLNQSLDRMTTGGFAAAPGQAHETTEFAAVYSKLNTIEREFQGARANATRLRGDVEQLLDRLEQAVLLFDSSGRLSIASAQVQRLLDRDPAELTGCSVDQVFPASTEIGAVVGPAVRNGAAVDGRIVWMMAGNREYSVLVNVEPLAGARGETGHRSMVTLRDADTRGEIAAQLDLANRLAALGQLTHGVAHEIKNPLNAIRLHVEILRSHLDGDAPEVDIIAREISRLDRVVKTFLNFNRPVEPHLAPIDLNELARDVARLVTPDAEWRNIRVVERMEGTPAMLNGDRDLLKQAFLNVVTNAVEAMTMGGELRIEIQRAGGRVEMLVSDTGPGIPNEIRGRIFDLYFSTKQHGSGIGLPMTFRFVQLHDGRIDFTSEAGRGTTFRFSFPEAASRTMADPEPARTRRG